MFRRFVKTINLGMFILPVCKVKIICAILIDVELLILSIQFLGARRMKNGDLLEKIKILALNIVEREGVSLDRLEFRNTGKRAKLVIYIDKEGGVSLKDCERVSKRLSAALDVEDPIPYSYTLDVSSPGLDRPLYGEDDYKRFKGRTAIVHTREKINGRNRIRGTIGDVENGSVTLIEGKEATVIPMVYIKKGRLDFDF